MTSIPSSVNNSYNTLIANFLLFFIRRWPIFKLEFTGAESTIRKAVKELKVQQTVPPHANVPLSYEQVRQFKLIGVKLLFLSMVKKLSYILSVEGSVIAVIYLYKYSNRLMKKHF